MGLSPSIFDHDCYYNHQQQEEEQEEDEEEVYFSAISSDYDDEGEGEGEVEDLDEILAEELQLQEILFQENCHPQFLISCTICMDSKPLHQFMEISSCHHSFCLSCINRYVESKLDENTAMIRCPEPGCREGALEPLSCQWWLHGSTFERWCSILCLSMVKAKVYCPYTDCSGMMEADGHEALREAECGHCRRMFCTRCRVPWHQGRVCGDSQEAIEEEEKDVLLRELAAKLKWQRCPQCRIMVERIEGCRFMKCRCDCCFCYICASPMSQEDQYCYNCKD
ncbi:E3 ubiquitin-protein ligase RNF144A-like [Zingiber officinale]|uniref:RBR-type E3 ubiquitin transferase n=1 Tax=Zingiber officinale TaxID=94328 RepID=A0A8J5LYC4_ZINOF|nr:E3 ubiquitin-protein ligase RNF144A-like [Zingiber officinale]KAG6528317.1 hypothetical protein ZIOFF_010470 [Zingiber officinale]